MIFNMLTRKTKGILVVIIALILVFLMILFFVNYFKEKEIIGEEEIVEEKELTKFEEFEYRKGLDETLDFVFMEQKPKMTNTKSVGSFLYFSWEEVESEKIVAVRIYRNDKPDSIYATYIAEIEYPSSNFLDSTNTGDYAYYWICFVDKLGFEGPWSDRIYIEKKIVDLPKNLRGYAEGNNIVLLWDSRVGSEIIYYNVYRGSSNNMNKTVFINKVYFPTTEYVDKIETKFDTLYYWVSAVDAAGNESERSNFLEVALKETNYVTNTEQSADKFILEQNYPNPCNSLTVIPFTLNTPGNVILKIYDIAGKEIETLLNEYKDVGRYEFNYNVGNLASGVYIYIFVMNDFIDKKKFVVIK